MGFWMRRDADGRRRFGLGIYLSIVLVTFALGTYLVVLQHRPRGGEVGTLGGGTTRVVREGSEPGQAAQVQDVVAGAMVGRAPQTPVVEDPLGQSPRGQTERGEAVGEPTVEEPEGGGLDTVGQFLRRQRRDPVPAQPVVVEPPPPPSATQTRDVVPELSIDRLVLYEAPKAEPSVEAPASDGGADRAPISDEFLPRGTLIPAVLLSRVETGRSESFVTLAVAENVRFRGQPRLLYGTRLLGSAAQDGTRDRVNINVDTILFDDGRELPVSGVVLGVDRMVGVKARRVNPPLNVVAAPALARIAGGALAGLLETEQVTEIESTGSTSIIRPVNRVRPGLRNELLLATREVADQYATEYLRQTLEDNMPYLEVPRGEAVLVQLRSALDLRAARVGASLEDNRVPPPGFRNTPFTPAGVVWDGSAAERRPSGGEMVLDAEVTDESGQVRPVIPTRTRDVETGQEVSGERRIGTPSPVRAREATLGR